MIIRTQFISTFHPFLSFDPLPGLVSVHFMCALSWCHYYGTPQPERSPRFRLPLACFFALRYCLLQLYWLFCAVNFLQNRSGVAAEAVTGSCAIPRAESRLELRKYDECPKTVSRAQRSPVLAPCSTLGSHMGLRTNGLLGQRLGAEIRKQVPRSDFELDPTATPRQGF